MLQPPSKIHVPHSGNEKPNPVQRFSRLFAFLLLATLSVCVPAAMGAPTAHNISAGSIQLTNVPGNDTVTISSLKYSINDFRLVSTSKGTANIQIGSSLSDDAANGILMTSISVNITTNYVTNNYNISMIETNANGSYHIAVYQSGTLGLKENADTVGAYFPYSTWIGGHARSEPYLNGGTNSLFTGSPGLVNGVHYIDWHSTNAIVSGTGANLGRSTVDLRPFGIDSRTDGILLVNHGKDRAGDGNYAESSPAADGTWTCLVRDHGGGAEQDPLAFVFIPRTNTTVISGKFKGSSTNGNLITMFSGASPQFTVTNTGTGRWDLRIPGHGATNGVLILSTEGGGSQNGDNGDTYQAYADGSGWEIQSRDLPAGGLQTPGAGADIICSFVYIPGPTPGITVTPTNNLQTTEGGGTATFSVVLDAKPTADVTINISSSDTTEGTVSVSSLTFTAANYSTPQIVTVTGVDDPDKDGSIPYTIITSAATSADLAYNGVNPSDVSVVNIDNEPGIAFSKNSVITTEAGGSDTFTVFLNTQPTGDVSFGLTSSDTTEGTVSPASLTFTAGNWNVPQTVTVTGVSDAIADGNVVYSIVTAPATSTDADYNGVNPLDISAVNLDDDAAALSFSASTFTVSETGTATNFTVVLTSEPTANVTVNIVSSDSTEGIVSPASRTFTPLNWFTPQTFTLTGVDDAVNDGNIAYSLNVTVTSSDATYAAFAPVLSATTLDNEAALTLPSGTLYYGVGQPALGIDGQATVTDPDTADYNTGSLTFSLTANASADDRLEIRNVGTGPGQIGTSGNNVTYGGTTIGTFSGGVGTSPLVVSFNANSTAAAAQELIRNVTFRNVTSSPATAPRTLLVALADGHGGTSSASKQIVVSLVHVADFQDGVDRGYGAYNGENDIELWNLQPDTAYPAGSDPVNGIQINNNNQALLRFDNIVGTAPGQIPSDAIIVSADLMLHVNNGGSGTPLYRMLKPWDATNDTWTSWGGGIDKDNIEATNAYFSQIGTFPVSGATTTGTILVSVLPDIQAWVGGQSNFGWVLPAWDFATDNTVFTPSEGTNAVDRPRLVVKWVPAGTASASFRYGVNGYTSAHDTRLRKGSPDTDYSAVTAVFVDAEVTSPNNDPEEPLLRFEDIVGTNPGQIPPNANVQIAVLDLASVVGDAMGDGGKIHAMLQPWQDTSTWNSMVNGISADGVEAAITPTAVAGNSSLTPDVQGGYLTFEVTPDVQAWSSNTRPNYGWAFIPWPAGGNGWAWSTAEATDPNTRPQLRVYYTAVAPATPIVINSISRGATSATIKFTAAPSTAYTVLRSSTVNGTYSSVGTITTQSDGTATFVDSTSLPPDAGFYRISNP
jgi:hypothetical protein